MNEKMCDILVYIQLQETDGKMANYYAEVRMLYEYGPTFLLMSVLGPHIFCTLYSMLKLARIQPSISPLPLAPSL